MEINTGPFDDVTLRRFYGHIPTGVLALAAMTEDGPVAMAVSSFTTVSLSPPLVVVSIRRESRTWQVLRGRPRIGGSMLSDTQSELARKFAAGLAKDRCGDSILTVLSSGAVLVEGAASWFEATLVQEHDAGDHVLAVIELDAIGEEPLEAPLVFHRSDFGSLSMPCVAASRS